jgi:hypothetical protein
VYAEFFAAHIRIGESGMIDWILVAICAYGSAISARKLHRTMLDDYFSRWNYFWTFRLMVAVEAMLFSLWLIVR